jgi:hypothetical protein
MIAIYIAGASSAIAESNSYICVAEESTGFSFDEGTRRWGSRNFHADSKYILSKSSSKEGRWEVKEVGTSFGTGCDGGFDDKGFVECSGLIHFEMNNKSLRYIVVHKYGYVASEFPKDGPFNEGSITPYIEIGKCSPL